MGDHSQSTDGNTATTTLRHALQALIHELYFKSRHFPGLKGHSPRALHDADHTRYETIPAVELLGDSDPFTDLITARARALPTGNDPDRTAAIIEVWQRAESTLNARARSLFGFLGESLPPQISSLLTGDRAPKVGLRVMPGRNPIGGKRSDRLFGQPDIVLLGETAAITIEMKVRGGRARAMYDARQHFRYMRLAEALHRTFGIERICHVLLAPINSGRIVKRADAWLSSPVAHGRPIALDPVGFFDSLPTECHDEVISCGGMSWLRSLDERMPSRVVDLGVFLDDVERLSVLAGVMEPVMRNQIEAIRRFGLRPMLVDASPEEGIPG